MFVKINETSLHVQITFRCLPLTLRLFLWKYSRNIDKILESVINILSENQTFKNIVCNPLMIFIVIPLYLHLFLKKIDFSHLRQYSCLITVFFLILSLNITFCYKKSSFITFISWLSLSFLPDHSNRLLLLKILYSTTWLSICLTLRFAHK